jgi:Fe-S cluster assembly protein SufB
MNNKRLTEQLVREISAKKDEPHWMTDFRLNALEIFFSKTRPSWGADLSELSFDDICYYLKPFENQNRTWDEVPEKVKDTFAKLGIMQAEQELLAGVGAQYESEMIYKKLKTEWQQKGVLFLDTETALKTYPDLFKTYFATVIPPDDNMFAALNSAVWSGGSFVYVPPGVVVDLPLQAYFRINSPRMGQFERTLIIADKNSSVHYIEGCSAPVYRSNSLHSAVVELVALDGAHIRYTTIQNWSNNVYNLVTKRAIAQTDATVSWIDGNFGSKVTMKYPCVILKGERSKGHVVSVALAAAGQHQDAGAKIIHLAPHTSSYIVSKSISKNGGRTSYRGLVRVARKAAGARSKVQCDALLLDADSRSDTYPRMIVNNSSATVEHEATVSQVSQEQLFYLELRGLSQQAARGLVVGGFVDEFFKELPMEYAVELNRLIAAEFEGSIG